MCIIYNNCAVNVRLIDSERNKQQFDKVDTVTVFSVIAHGYEKVITRSWYTVTSLCIVETCLVGVS